MREKFFKGQGKRIVTLLVLALIFGVLLIAEGNTAMAAPKKLKVKAEKTVAVKCKMTIKTNRKATFKSSNKKIATVNKKGVVTGKRAGKVTITVTDKKDKKQVKKIKIIVKNKLVVFNPNHSRVTMYVGDTLKIKTNIAAKYKKNNVNIRISKKGVVTARNVGTTKVTITSKKFKKLKKKITIVVKKKEASQTDDSNKENKTEESATEAKTEEGTTESGSTESSETEETTQDKSTESSATEDDYGNTEEEKTGYSRIEWLQMVLDVVEIQTVSTDSVQKNNYHMPIYTYNDDILEEDLLLLETGIQNQIIQAVRNPSGGAYFEPNKVITREEAVVMAVKALNYKAGDVLPDCQDVGQLTYPTWVQIALSKEMISLIDGSFCGNSALSIKDGEQILSVVKKIHDQDKSVPEEIQDVKYNPELIMESVDDITAYTVEEVESGYLVTLPLVNVEELGIAVGKTIYLPADDMGQYSDGFSCNIQEVTITEEAVILAATPVTDIADIFEEYHLSGQRQPTKFIPAESVKVVSGDSNGEIGIAQASSSEVKKENVNTQITINGVDTKLSYEDNGMVVTFNMKQLPTLNFEFIGNKDGIEYIKLSLENTASISVQAGGEVSKRIELGQIVDFPIGKGFKVGGKLIAVISAEGKVSYEIEVASELGFEYDTTCRSIHTINTSEKSNVGVAIKGQIGPEIYLYWVTEKIMVVDFTGLVGIGVGINFTSGADAEGNVVKCQERSLCASAEVVAGADDESLLHTVLEKCHTSISWSFGEWPLVAWHYEAPISSDDYKKVEHCSISTYTLSGQVLTLENELVEGATIYVENVNDNSNRYICTSDIYGQYALPKPVPEGKYRVSAVWDGVMKYNEEIEISKNIKNGHDIIECESKTGEGYYWLINKSGELICIIDESAIMEDVRNDIMEREKDVISLVLSGKCGEDSFNLMALDFLKSIDLSGLDTSNVTNMSDMLYGCTNLEILNINNLNTSNVTDMRNMFACCENLLQLDVSGLNTSNVTNMQGMFYQCHKIKSLNVSGFETGNVTDMSCMFFGCWELSSLDVSNFNTSNVTNMEGTFAKLMTMESLDLSNFDTSNVTNMSYMFESSKGLVSLDLSSFDTSNTTTMLVMFFGCSSLRDLDLSHFNVDNIPVVEIQEMFIDCPESILPDWYVPIE